MSDALIGTSLLSLTIKAKVALTANRFCAPEDSGGLTDVATADVQAGGVVRDNVAAGKVGDKIVIGTAWVETSENLAAGDPVAADADGKAKLADGTEIVLGVALKATNSGDFAEILLGNAGIF